MRVLTVFEVLPLQPDWAPLTHELLETCRDTVARWTLEGVRSEIRMGHSFCIWKKDKLAAILLGHDAADHFEVTQLATGPNFRQKGLATRLIRYVRENYKKPIWLEVREDNVGAVTFYENQGFRKVGLRPAYYGDGVAAILYQHP